LTILFIHKGLALHDMAKTKDDLQQRSTHVRLITTILPSPMDHRRTYELPDGFELELIAENGSHEEDSYLHPQDEMICMEFRSFPGTFVVQRGMRVESFDTVNSSANSSRPSDPSQAVLRADNEEERRQADQSRRPLPQSNESQSNPEGRRGERTMIEMSARRSSSSRSQVSAKPPGYTLFPFLQHIQSTIPDYIRQARALARKPVDVTDPNPSFHVSPTETAVPKTNCLPPPTKLHALCAEANVSLAELEAALSEDPKSVSVLDGRERTPLHIIADNDSLFCDRQGKFVVMNFVLILIKAYPGAITMVDSSERMPFVPLIEDWCIWVYEKHEQESKQRKKEIPDPYHSRGARKGATRVIKRVTGQLNDQVDTLRSGSKESVDVEGSDQASSLLHSRSSRFYPRVDLWEEVVFCFEMLSLVMDELGGKNGGLHSINREAGSLQSSDDDKTARADLATHIVLVLPSLLKTALLIESEGGHARRRLLGMPIFRRLILCPEAVGPWLTTMLRRKGVPAKRAVDFLVLVSEAKTEDYVGGFRTVLQDDVHEFEGIRHQIFEAMGQLESTIASLVVLEDKDTERAASCAAIWHIMNRNLARPFVVSLLSIDLILHIILILVRAIVSPFVCHANINTKLTHCICCITGCKRRCGTGFL
jgi:hypothetical protein